MRSRFPRAAFLSSLLGAITASAALLVGCTSDRDDIIVSPLPPGVALSEIEDEDQGSRRLDTTEDLAGSRLDEVLAVVEGEPLRLRALTRRLGIPRAEASDSQYQEEIASEIKKWAIERLFQKAAEREGIEIPASRLDTFVEDLMKGQLERSSEELGSPVTREEYLESEGVTFNEWRERKRRELLEQLYVERLARGLSGARPQIDLKVDPSEIRRFYRRVPELSEVPKGVRIVQMEVTYESVDPGGEGDTLETQPELERRAKALAASLQAGGEPEALAEQFNIGDNWAALPPGGERFLPLRAIADPEMRGWFDAPGRRKGDARVMPLTSTGVKVIAIIAMQQAEIKSLADPEFYDFIEGMIQRQRLANLRNRLLLKFLRRGRVVWPERLADEIYEDARKDLRDQQKQPELRGLRLR